MATLRYSAITSLDGYVADRDGNFHWGEPDQEVHTFVNDLERPVGTYLYGRRMYEVMVAWDDPEIIAGQPPYIHDFAEMWRAADKVVYSTSLDTVSSARTRIERTFEPKAIRGMKTRAEGDLSVAGATVAARAFEAGLVDELHLIVAPVAVGGGLPALPEGVQLDLELLDERRFANGMVFLRYAVGR